MQAGPSDLKGMPVKREKRKLACAACRARRIRCEWPLNGTGCIACALAELRCPGEPEPRKRTKKGAEGAASGTAVAGQGHQGDKVQLGGALTFHLIESLFVMANPSVPGMDYWLLRDVLHAAGGASKEMEIAAECLCSAFIASSATFSDHATIVGPGDVKMPTESMSGSVGTFDHLVDYGARRSRVVGILAERAGVMFDESGMKDRPGVVVIYTLLAMDQCSTLTSDGGRKSREHVLGAVHQLKHLLERHDELPPAQLEALRGPLGRHILLLDAQSAALLRGAPAFSDQEMSAYFPHIDFSAIPSPNFDPSRLVPEEEGWVELGKQLEPIYLYIISLYRTFLRSGNDLPSTTNIESLWRGIDSTMEQLILADAVIAAVAPLDTKEATQRRQFDLLSLTHSCRRDLLRLDLLLHQRVIEAALAAEGSPEAAVLQNYQVSRQRVQRVFKDVTDLAKHAVFHCSLIQIRRLFKMLEVCSTWTSLRTADRDSAAELVAELGLGEDDAALLHQGLGLAAWSSSLAAEQRRGLRNGVGGPPIPPPAALPAPPPQQQQQQQQATPAPAPPPPPPQQSQYPPHPNYGPSAAFSQPDYAHHQQHPSLYAVFPGSAPELGQLPPHHLQHFDPYQHQQQHPPQHQHHPQQFASLGITSSFLNAPPPMQGLQSQSQGFPMYQDGTTPSAGGMGVGWDEWQQRQQQHHGAGGERWG